MTDHSDLIARLQEGDGPDRELDIAIAISVGRDPYDLSAMLSSVGDDCFVSYTNVGSHWNANFATKFGSHTIPIPKFTASLDACRALQAETLPGSLRDVDSLFVTGPRFRVVIFYPVNDDVHPVPLPNGKYDATGEHPTSEERAWLIAILRAKEAQRHD